jgi:hypothetical protein
VSSCGEEGYAEPLACVVCAVYLLLAMTLRATTDNFGEPRLAAVAGMQMTVICRLL